MPKRPKGHVIGDAGELLFQSLLPPDWVAHSLTAKDYGIDFIVEVFKAGYATGIQFAAQVKASEHWRPRGQAIPIRLKTERVHYYIEKRTDPVFLIAVDLAKRRSYWCFLQAYFLDDHRGALQPGRSKTTVHVPLANCLDDSDEFKAAIEKAHRYMCALHPAALETALAAEKKKLEALDPRFHIEVEARPGGINYNLLPKQDCQITITLKGDDSAKQAQDLVNRGVPVEVGATELEVTGSPLFLGEERPSTIQWSRSFDVSVVLKRLDGAGHALGRLDLPQASLVGGLKELRYRADLPNLPLIFGFTIVRDTGMRMESICFDFDAARWCGQALPLLAYFEQIWSLLSDIQPGTPIRVECSSLGNHLFTANLDFAQLGGFANVPPLLSTIRKARFIAAHFKIAPTLSEPLTSETQLEIDEMYDLITQREHRHSACGMHVQCVVPAGSLREALRNSASDAGSPWTFTGTAGRWTLLGHQVKLPDATLELHGFEPTTNLRALADRTSLEDCELDFVGTERSAVLLRAVS